MKPHEGLPRDPAGSVPRAARPGLDERVETRLCRRELPVFLVVVAVGLVLAWNCRFVQDDAFISFTYARNLVRGDGPTWSGARVEGYTNPLWVLWIAAGLRLGVEPILWSQIGGLLSFAAALAAVRRLALRLFGRVLPTVLTLALLVVNYSFLAYATGGLETMAQTALLAWAAVAAVGPEVAAGRGVARAASLSLLLAAAVLTRPDSALPCLILAAWGARGLARRRAPRAAWAAFVLPFALVIGGWLAWKLAYYGRLLPNTFYAKTGVTAAMTRNGAVFVLRFLHWYALWPVLALGPACLIGRRRAPEAPGSVPQAAWRAPASRLLLPSVLVATWLAYVIVVGGDFMEFRVLVPIAPFLFLLLAWLACDPIARRLGGRATLVSVALVAVLAAASIRHAATFRSQTADQALDSLAALGNFYGIYPDGDWSDLGRALGEKLAGTDALLALHAAGAIPYYSGLRTVDQLGLTDAWVAEHGWRPDASYRRPGHQRHAPLAYLRERGVNFVIGHPTLVPLDVFVRAGADPQLRQMATDWVYRTTPLNPEPIPRVRLVLLPARPGLGLVMWYLTPKPAIDAAIVAGGWPTWEFTPVPDAPR